MASNSDHTVEAIESQEHASVEPFGVTATRKLKGKYNHNSRDASARQAMVVFLTKSPHWHHEADIVRGCRHALPNDSEDAADLVHRQVTKNPKTFKYRKPPGDKKVTLMASLRDGLVQYDADID